MTTTKSEALNFYWHCEVAALVIRRLPVTTATRNNSLHAVRKATLCAAGRQGVTHASAMARAHQQSLSQPWSACQLIQEHAVPVGYIHQRVRAALATDVDDEAARTARQAMTDDLAANGVPAAAIAALPLTADACRVAEIVRGLTQLAWLTTDEHDALRRHSLHKDMPRDWDGVDRFARYRVCAIDVAEV